MPYRPYKSPTQPLCRGCGKPIKKTTRTVYFAQTSDQNLGSTIEQRTAKPLSLAEAQRLFNQRIVFQRWKTPEKWVDGDYQPTGEPRYISEVRVWDGETYEDEFFCKLQCSSDFAYMCVRSPKLTIQSVAYRDALEAQTRQSFKELTAKRLAKEQAK